MFNALSIHDEALCSVSVWALYIGQPMLLFPYLLRCYRLYFVFNYNIEQNENVRRNQFISNNSPRRNAGGRSGRSSPVNGHLPSGTVRSSAPLGPRRGNSLSPSRNPSRRRAKDGSNNMDDLAEIFYNDRSLSNSSEKDFFHKYSHRMSESWLLQRFLMCAVCVCNIRHCEPADDIATARLGLCPVQRLHARAPRICVGVGID